MKIPVLSILSDLDGVPLVDGAVIRNGVTMRPERPFTLRKACTEALNNQLVESPPPDGEEKFKRYQLSVKINSVDEPDLSAEEIAMLKRLIGIGFGGLIVGRCFAVLDPTPSRADPA